MAHLCGSFHRPGFWSIISFPSRARTSRPPYRSFQHRPQYIAPGANDPPLVLVIDTLPQTRRFRTPRFDHRRRSFRCRSHHLRVGRFIFIFLDVGPTRVLSPVVLRDGRIFLQGVSAGIGDASSRHHPLLRCCRRRSCRRGRPRGEKVDAVRSRRGRNDARRRPAGGRIRILDLVSGGGVPVGRTRGPRFDLGKIGGDGRNLRPGVGR
mmetsp:Transcript_3946/g.10891  ORF Transcript_3946/g.10891 Transcript_3946/m.10891 type:complete len:208 (-) Transcript_3946:1408-2031(-)